MTVKTQTKTFPPAKALATPTTEMTADQVQAVTEAINPLIADSFALYVKTKNFHWHLSGPKFRDLHLLFDEQAESILGSIDPMAERIRRISGTTIRSIGHISKLQTIQDDNEDFVPAEQMVKRLLHDHEHIAQAQRAAIDVCEENEDPVTSNVLQEILDETQRRMWFLFEISQGFTEQK